MSDKSTVTKFPWRKNVLTLVSIAYAVVLLMFLGTVVSSNISAPEAWDMLEAPLMALIGGSLTLSFKLIEDDESAAVEQDEGESGQSDKSDE